MTADAREPAGSASARTQDLLRTVEEQVAARREQLAALRNADGSPPPESPQPGVPATPPPPGTYMPDLTSPRRLALAPELDSRPEPGAPASSGAEAGAPVGAPDLRDLAGAIATMARRLEELATTLERATHRATSPRPHPAPPGPAPARSGPLSEALQASAPIAPGAPAPTNSAAGELRARLVAIEMAVAGATRGEVALRLGREFFGEDASAILDDVFGSGSAGAARMPWS